MILSFFKADLAILEMPCLLTDFLVCAYIYVRVCASTNRKKISCILFSVLHIMLCLHTFSLCSTVSCFFSRGTGNHLWLVPIFSSAVSNYFSWSNHLWFMILYTPLHFYSCGAVIFYTPLYCLLVFLAEAMSIICDWWWFSRASGTGKCQWKKVQSCKDRRGGWRC